METPITKPTLVVDHLVLRTATKESEINHLRQALNQVHYLKAGRAAGFSDYSAKHMSEKMPRLCHAG